MNCPSWKTSMSLNSLTPSLWRWGNGLAQRRKRTGQSHTATLRQSRSQIPALAAMSLPVPHTCRGSSPPLTSLAAGSFQGRQDPIEQQRTLLLQCKNGKHCSLTPPLSSTLPPPPPSPLLFRLSQSFRAGPSGYSRASGRTGFFVSSAHLTLAATNAT